MAKLVATAVAFPFTTCPLHKYTISGLALEMFYPAVLFLFFSRVCLSGAGLSFSYILFKNTVCFYCTIYNLIILSYYRYSKTLL